MLEAALERCMEGYSSSKKTIYTKGTCLIGIIKNLDHNITFDKSSQKIAS